MHYAPPGMANNPTAHQMFAQMQSRWVLKLHLQGLGTHLLCICLAQNQQRLMLTPWSLSVCWCYRPEVPPAAGDRGCTTPVPPSTSHGELTALRLPARAYQTGCIWPPQNGLLAGLLPPQPLYVQLVLAFDVSFQEPKHVPCCHIHTAELLLSMHLGFLLLSASFLQEAMAAAAPPPGLVPGGGLLWPAAGAVMPAGVVGMLPMPGVQGTIPYHGPQQLQASDAVAPGAQPLPLGVPPLLPEVPGNLYMAGGMHPFSGLGIPSVAQMGLGPPQGNGFTSGIAAAAGGGLGSSAVATIPGGGPAAAAAVTAAAAGGVTSSTAMAFAAADGARATATTAADGPKDNPEVAVARAELVGGVTRALAGPAERQGLGAAGPVSTQPAVWAPVDQAAVVPAPSTAAGGGSYAGGGTPGWDPAAAAAAPGCEALAARVVELEGQLQVRWGGGSRHCPAQERVA
jgi:hypothetical protein